MVELAGKPAPAAGAAASLLGAALVAASLVGAATDAALEAAGAALLAVDLASPPSSLEHAESARSRALLRATDALVIVRIETAFLRKETLKTPGAGCRRTR